MGQGKEEDWGTETPKMEAERGGERCPMATGPTIATVITMEGSAPVEQTMAAVRLVVEQDKQMQAKQLLAMAECKQANKAALAQGEGTGPTQGQSGASAKCSTQPAPALCTLCCVWLDPAHTACDMQDCSR